MGNFRAFLSTRFVKNVSEKKSIFNFQSFRIQNVDSIIKPEDRELPITNLRGEVLFNSWNNIFSSGQGNFISSPRIMSFSGKNVLNDPNW